jgi:uncharacterized protein
MTCDDQNMLGTVARLRRYPVKSVLGEDVGASAVGRHGLAGDRRLVTAEVPAETMEIGGGGPPGTFVDFAPIHLLTTSTLDRIADLSPRRTAHPERYRPNIVIRTPVPGFTENDWLGRNLHIGDGLILGVIARTPRCAVPTLSHGDLPREAEALRVLARHNRVQPVEESDPEPCAGVYAEVLIPGRIRVGDPVRPA